MHSYFFLNKSNRSIHWLIRSRLLICCAALGHPRTAASQRASYCMRFHVPLCYESTLSASRRALISTIQSNDTYYAATFPYITSGKNTQVCMKCPTCDWIGSSSHRVTNHRHKGDFRAVMTRTAPLLRVSRLQVTLEVLCANQSETLGIASSE